MTEICYCGGHTDIECLGVIPHTDIDCIGYPFDYQLTISTHQGHRLLAPMPLRTPKTYQGNKSSHIAHTDAVFNTVQQGHKSTSAVTTEPIHPSTTQGNESTVSGLQNQPQTSQGNKSSHIAHTDAIWDTVQQGHKSVASIPSTGKIYQGNRSTVSGLQMRIRTAQGHKSTSAVTTEPIHPSTKQGNKYYYEVHTQFDEMTRQGNKQLLPVLNEGAKQQQGHKSVASIPSTGKIYQGNRSMVSGLQMIIRTAQGHKSISAVTIEPIHPSTKQGNRSTLSGLQMHIHTAQGHKSTSAVILEPVHPSTKLGNKQTLSRGSTSKQYQGIESSVDLMTTFDEMTRQGNKQFLPVLNEGAKQQQGHKSVASIPSTGKIYQGNRSTVSGLQMIIRTAQGHKSISAVILEPVHPSTKQGNKQFLPVLNEGAKQQQGHKSVASIPSTGKVYQGHKQAIAKASTSKQYQGIESSVDLMTTFDEMTRQGNKSMVSTPSAGKLYQGNRSTLSGLQMIIRTAQGHKSISAVTIEPIHPSTKQGNKSKVTVSSSSVYQKQGAKSVAYVTIGKQINSRQGNRQTIHIQDTTCSSRYGGCVLGGITFGD